MEKSSFSRRQKPKRVSGGLQALIVLRLEDGRLFDSEDELTVLEVAQREIPRQRVDAGIQAE